MDFDTFLFFKSIRNDNSSSQRVINSSQSAVNTDATPFLSIQAVDLSSHCVVTFIMATNKVSNEEGFDTNKRDPNYDEVKDGCFLFRWLQLHTFINFGRSICRPLKKSDLFNIGEDLYPEINLRKSRLNRAADPNLTLTGVLMKKLILWEFLWAGFLAMIGAGLAFAGPLVIKEVMAYLKLKKTSAAQTQAAFTYVGIWIVLYFVRIFCLQYADRLMFSQAVKVQQVLTLELLEKNSKLSPAYKLNLKKGDLLKYLSNDVKMAFNFVRSCAALFSAPLTLIVVQAFIFKDNGLYGFVLFGVLVIAAIVQVILNRKMSETQNEKIRIMGRRISTNLELFTSVRQIKLLGWENLIMGKNGKYRIKQNQLNKKYFFLANIYDMVINLTPALSVFLIFLLQMLLNGGSNFDTSTVYSTLAFIGMTYSPTKSLMAVIITVVNGKAALMRIDDFLQADQIVDAGLHDSSLERGYILINQLRASWETEKANQKFLKKNGETNEDEDESQVELVAVQNKPVLQDSANVNINKTDQYGKKVVSPTIDIELVRRRSSVKFQLLVLNQITIKPGERIIFLSEADGGKSTFFHTILGNLNIISGQLKYRGKIGYCPQKHWFKKASMRDNVLFGLPYNVKKLKRIYSHTLLEQQLKLFPKGDETVIKNLTNLTQSQKRKLSLARALYSEPDILILDAIFQTFEHQTKEQVYKTLCKHYSKMTILISSHSTDFIKPQDRVILLQNGALKQAGTFKELMKNKQSYLHELLDIQEQNVKYTLSIEQKQLIEEQKLKRQRRIETRKKKLRQLIKQLAIISKTMTKKQIVQQIIVPAEQNAIKKQQVAQAKRLEGVSIAMYFKFLASSSVLLSLILFFLSLLTQATKVFSDWWVGSIKALPWKLTDINALFVYIGLTVGFCIFFFMAGCLSPSISALNSENILTLLTRSLSLKDFTWYESQNPLKVAGRLNRDYEQYFTVNTLMQNIFKNFLLFLSTVVLVGYKTPVFFAIASGVMIINICILLLFMRAQREMASLGGEFSDNVNFNFDDMINGVDVLRAFNKIDEYKSAIRKNCYGLELWRMNNKFLYQGMNILCELTSLIIIAGTTFFAVSSKTSSLSPEEIAVIGTAISLCTKLTGTMTSIIKDCVNLENGVKGTVKNAYDMIDKDLEKNYEDPKPPASWPQNNSIQFKSVTLRNEGISDPIVKQVTFSIQSGQNVVIWGKQGHGSKLLLNAVNCFRQPSNNSDNTKGVVLIGNVDLHQIGRKYIAEKVMMLTPVPFIFTGTIRQNINPFDKSLQNDSKMHRCLQQVKLWDEITINPNTQKQLIEQPDEIKAKLSHFLEDGGCELSLGLQQKLNIARALYWKPNVLLCDSATCSVDTQTEEQLEKSLRDQLKETTLMVITQETDTAAQSDKIICMYNGRIKEEGRPQDLVANPKSKFGKMLKQSNPGAYKKLEAIRKKMQANTEIKDRK